MVNSIDAIQQRNIYKVDAVSFFGNNRNSTAAQNNIFSSNLFAQQDNNEYNLNHPLVAGSETQAQCFDLLA